MRYIQKAGKLYPYSEYVDKFGKPEQRTAPASNIINKSFDAYESPVSGKIISNHKQRNEDMKVNNCVDYEPSLREASTVTADNADSALELKMERDVERQISNLSSDQQGSLEQELNAGADISYERH